LEQNLQHGPTDSLQKLSPFIGGRLGKCCRREWDGEAGPQPLAREGWLYLELDKLFTGPPPKFLVTQMLIGAIFLISQGQFEEPVRPCLF